MDDTNPYTILNQNPSPTTDPMTAVYYDHSWSSNYIRVKVTVPDEIWKNEGVYSYDL